jgi:hypothetical protein
MALKPISPAQARADLQKTRLLQQAVRKQNMQQQQTSPNKPKPAPVGQPYTPANPIDKQSEDARYKLMEQQAMDQQAMDSAKAQQAKPIAGPAPAPMQTGAPLSAGMGNAPMGNAPMATPAPMGAGAGMGQPATMVQPAPAMMRRGGSVKNKQTAKFSSSGAVSKASSRGDGIAQRGKTKGRMC